MLTSSQKFLTQCLAVCLAPAGLWAYTTVPGDLNNDFDATVADIAMLVSHIQGTQFLDSEAVPFVDFDQNGILNNVDVEALAAVVLESQGPQEIPSAAIKETLPLPGESDVGVKRETVLYFSLPLAEDTIISNDNFFALFDGEKLLTRIEVSSDRLKASLFYLDPLPDNARVRVIFDGTGIKDILGRDLDADHDREPGGIFALDFNTVSITELPGTTISGSVFQSKKNEMEQDVPLAGVVIEVVGAEETIRTTTAADGSFTLDPCPAGRFFVNIDGRPVTGNFPNGDYYPFVGKAWFARPGRTDNLVNEDGKIYLPLVTGGSLKTVSSTENTVVDFPQTVVDENPDLEGVRVTVPPNSLFNEEGTRGGMVGIAPVEPDRIPEPLPEGLNLPLVITVQTDGPANFDRPAPVVFPNRPDPETGERLPPGSKTALWSFNHDSGEWEIGGPMTVSDDGLTVSSDPGVGIRQPGWHGTRPGTSNSGGGGRRGRGPDDNDEDDCPDPNGCPDDDPDPDPDPDPDDEDEDDCKTEALLAVTGLVQTQLAVGLAVPKLVPGLGTAITTKINTTAFAVDSFIAPDQSQDFFESAATNTAIGAASEIPQPHIAAAAEYAGILQTAIGFGERLGDLAGCVAPLPLNGLSSPGSDEIQAKMVVMPFLEHLVQNFDETEFPLLAKMPRYLEIQFDYLQAAYDYYVAYFGSDVWLRQELDQSDEVQLYVQFIFQKLVDDFAIGETEKNLILTSPLRIPGFTFSDQDILDLVDLLNDRSTVGFTQEHFDNLKSSAQEIITELQAILDETPYEDPYFFWNQYLPALWRELFPPPPPVDTSLSRSSSGGGGGGGGSGDEGGQISYTSSNLPLPGEHFYKLRNINERTERRGQTNKLGQVDNLILASNSTFIITYYKPDTNEIALGIFRTPGAGSSNRIPISSFFEAPETEPDADGDGVPDLAEDVAGTDPGNPDSDGDGVQDGAEMNQGENPLDNTLVGTGLMASIPVPGNLERVVARNDILVAAASSRVYLFDISSRFQPIQIGSFWTDVVDIALQGDLVAVATGDNSLLILDIRDPASPEQFRNVRFSGERVVSVAMDGNLIFAGLASGKIATVEAILGSPISEELITGTPQDLVLNNDFVYAVVDDAILTLQRQSGIVLDHIHTYNNEAINNDERLFLGKGVLYSTIQKGYLTLDLSDPAQPVENRVYDFDQFGWKDIRLNGSGLMIAATSPNLAFDGPHHVDVYDVGASGFDSTYIETFATPQVTRSVSLYNGIAYAGGNRRLDVINYLPQDTGTEAPAISISSDSGDEAPEGNFASVSAEVSDDVQVRNVEFYLNGNRISRDGDYPFSLSYRVPAMDETQNNMFTISARAFDMAGNLTESNTLELTVVEDTFPPIILAAVPEDDSFHTVLDTVGFVPTKPIDPVNLNTSNFFLINSGNDFKLGTEDDFIADPGVIEFSSTSNVVYMRYEEQLPPGRYQVNVTTNIADLSGIHPLEDFQSEFLVFGVGETDSDGDGLPDEIENDIGYDAFEIDSDGDGIPDGEEDFDNDGLTNLNEFIVLGTDLQDADTDNDGLTDAEEIDFETDPLLEDTDDDGMEDGREIDEGTDPLDVDSDDDLLDDGTEFFKNFDPKNPTVLQHAVSAPVILYFKEFDSELENQGAVSKPVAHENQ